MKIFQKREIFCAPAINARFQLCSQSLWVQYQILCFFFFYSPLSHSLSLSYVSLLLLRSVVHGFLECQMRN